MKKWKNGIALLVLPMAMLAACNDTAKGMAEDTKENADAVGKATDKMADDVGEMSKDAAASTLTTRIKAAIVANPILNDKDNLVNVDSTAEEVKLSGHVVSSEAKEEAQKLAEQILKEVGATQKLTNDLEVRKPS